MNKANCNTCEHKHHPDGGHCYMYRTEPEVTCNAHTANSTHGIIKLAKDVSTLAHNKSISDEEFKLIATAMLTQMFASI